jgi:twitching motility protein PilT
MAALIQEINLSRDCHIVTIENPIEYTFRPKQAFIRQREVGRDTPSFEQALQDAMREDPDVLMVGEIRSPETMRLILNASETGHLVLTTMHSATVADAINRLILSFPSEIQSFVSSQLADVLIAVISQRLVFRKDLNLRVPECEILVSNSAVKSMLRKGEIFKLATALETGREDGMWTFERYRNWLASKNNWSFPKLAPADVAGSDLERPMPDAADLLPLRPRSSSATDSKILRQAPRVDDDEVLEIADENIELEELITQLKGNGDSEE